MRYLPQDNLRSVEEDQSAETAAQAYENSLRRATQRLLQKKKGGFGQIRSHISHAVHGDGLSNELRPAWHAQSADCARPRQTVEWERREYDALIERSVHGLWGVTIFDNSSDLFDVQYCYVKRSNIQLYVDSGHFTMAESQLMGAALARAVEYALGH